MIVEENSKILHNNNKSPASALVVVVLTSCTHHNGMTSYRSFNVMHKTQKARAPSRYASVTIAMD